jgi:uncharacterized protein YjiS (DUF1127 family)
MRHFTLITPAGSEHESWIDRGLARLAAGWLHFRRERRLKATINGIRGLDDRTLKDIGVDRSEIEAIVRSKAAGRRQRYVDVGGAAWRG